MFKKSFAIILSICLCLGLMIQGSFAFTYPATYNTIDSIIANRNSDYTPSYMVSNYNSFISDYAARYPYKLINSSLSPNEIVLLFSDVPLYIDSSNHIIAPQQAEVVYGYIDYFNLSVSTIQGTAIPGYNFYSFSPTHFSTSGTLYYSYDMRVYNWDYSTYTEHVYNLNDTYYVEPRYFSIWADDLGWAHDMIAISVNDVPDSDSYVSFDYTDSLGSWHTYLDISDGLFYTGEGELNYIYFDPLKISLYQFNLTGGIYYGSEDWGYYDYSCDLDFNETPLNFNDNFYDSYYYYNTTYTNYDNVRSAGFVSMYGNPTGTEPFYWDENEFLIQPFKFSIIAFPTCSDKNINPSFDLIDLFVSSYSDSFDILLLDVPESYFNYLYGAGAYAGLRSDLADYPTAIGTIGYINDWYSSNFLVPSQFPYSLKDSGITHTIAQTCGIIYTDSFFYKQLAYLIGDNSDILSEFSERFFKPNGFSDYLMSNLADMYTQDYDYYSDSLSYLTKINYYLNDAFEKQYLPSIISSLSSSNSYLLSIDSKLSDVDDILAALSDLTYLGDIDTKLEDLDDILTNTGSVLTGLGLLLSDTNDIVTILNTIELDSSASYSMLSDIYDFLENEFTFDVQVNLPEFDPTVIVQIYGQGIGDFIDFFNEWIMVLPDFDFSDFPDFFDNVSDTIDDFADSNDDLIGNLDSPYEYDDSKLHYLGWD